MHTLIASTSAKLLAIALMLLLGSCGGSSETRSPADSKERSVSESTAAAPTLEDDRPTPQVAESTSPPASDPAAAPDSPPAALDASAPSHASTAANTYPEIGVLTSAQIGDLMCYVTVEDMEGQAFERGATFELCDRQNSLLNQTARFVYSSETVADCESAEPCGRSRQDMLIADAVVLGESWEILSNDTWTVTVGRLESWDGTNGTGNLTYYGCDRNNNCLALTGGSMVCRNGICTMVWNNGSYTYMLSSTITTSGDAPTTLQVRQNGSEILRADNMTIVVSSDFLD